MTLEEEVKVLRQDVEYIKEILAELVEDSLLTPDEDEIVKEAKDAVRRGDLSAFIEAEEI
ncbi:MAG: hypothetical protein CW694_00455 [Candidatus Syntrophoarchaeum sp. WYZ-LMO15]|uniref:CARD domain-containing protein n=1 Tax=Candidatus Syntropharchaeum caldarium TaxID=1838285 RepID=A0A1F2P768_9EURY|nr:MAG: hypothetical protein SCAL_001765 [Candidatus Syntrophoarchaeum caldarius]RJS73465.1 MAG: hypothetical protein CW694_00455 [Candidatus Syntrophoarchaeum sp. WYZ-LMO15]